MEILKFLLKWFIVAVIVAAILIGGTSIYLAFFGKGTIEKALSDMLGSQVRFEAVSMDLGKGLVHFKGFTVLNKLEFEDNIFKADKFVVSIDKEKYDKDKVFAIQEVVIEKGVLNIERNKKGVFNIASLNTEYLPGEYGVAYAAEIQAVSGLYNFASNFRSIVITDSIVNFKDAYISQTPFTRYCDKFNFQFRTSPPSNGNIQANSSMSFRIPMQSPPHGTVSFKASMSVYPNRVDTEGTLVSKDINLTLFLPYLAKHTPFNFNSGSFSSTTTFRMHNNVIDSPTTVLLHNLRLAVKPGMENSQFMQTAVNRLAPYLQSGQNDLYFDFVIKGPADRPQAGLGPRVKFAIGMVVLEELSNAMQQIQKFKQ